MDDMMKWIEEQAMAANACFAAGVKAADETGPAARKLARLIKATEQWLSFTDDRNWRIGCECDYCVELRAAIEEARR
jgi:hypothetical protein